MRLYIGKNHDEKDASVPVQSIFRLAGSNEDALTYALGFLLARDPALCVALVRLCDVKPTRSFKDDYTVHLQEVTEGRFGRRDIVIEAGKVRVVIEAKIGKAEPTARQILKYSADTAKWRTFETRVVVSLTQSKLLTATKHEIDSKLPRRPKIRFASIQWHEVIDLVLRHSPSDGSDVVSQYLLDEFISYIRRDYDMGYYDAEILIQDMNRYNAPMFENGWVQLTSYRKRSPLYFAPYFTRNGANSGISKISRVVSEITLQSDDDQPQITPETEEQRKQWIQGLDMVREHVKVHDKMDYPVRVLLLDEPIPFRS